MPQRKRKITSYAINAEPALGVSLNVRHPVMPFTFASGCRDKNTSRRPDCLINALFLQIMAFKNFTVVHVLFVLLFLLVYQCAQAQDYVLTNRGDSLAGEVKPLLNSPE